MKKGLLTVLAASLVFVGCQNYDDQFDDLNAQISALKSQVDGLSSLSGQVASLSGTIAGLQSGIAAAQAAATAAGSAATAAGASADAATAAVNAIPEVDLSGLSASLTTLQAEIDAIEAQIASTATAAEVAALQTSLTAVETDLADLLISNNVYSTAITVDSAASMASALALGNKVALMNAAVTIEDDTTIADTDIQTFIDRIKTMNGTFTYDSKSATGYSPTYNELTAATVLDITQAGPISATALTSATVVTITTSYSTKITGFDMGAMTSVTSIASGANGSETAHTLALSSATNVDLGALARYGSAFTITTKKGATLDIASLDDKTTAGLQSDITLTLDGPAAYTATLIADGEIDLTNVATATVSGFYGTLDVNAGVEELTTTDSVTIDLDGAVDLVTATLDFKYDWDPDLTTAQAAVADDLSNQGYLEDYSATGSIVGTDLKTLTVSGELLDLYLDEANLESLTLTGVTMHGLTIASASDLVTLSVASGNTIGDISVTGSNNLLVADFNHTTNLDAVAAGTTASTGVETGVNFIVTDNLGLTTLNTTGDHVDTFTVTGNDALTAIDVTGLDDFGTTAEPAFNLWDNDLTATTASNTYDGETATATTGADGGTADAGTWDDGTSGMDTMKAYLTALAAEADSDGYAGFDTVSTENDTEANDGTTTTTLNILGPTSTPSTTNDSTVLYMVEAVANTADGGSSAISAKRGFAIDWASSGAVQVTINGTAIFDTTVAGAGTALTLGSSNKDLQISAIESAVNIERAAAADVTLDAKRGYGSSATVSLAYYYNEGSTATIVGERYTTTTANAAAVSATNFGFGIDDELTLSVGSNSITMSVSGASETLTDLADIGDGIVTVWDAKYGSGGTASALALASVADVDGVLTFTMLQTDSAGYDVLVSVSTAAGADTSTNGNNIDWSINADNFDDNKTNDSDIIVTFESTAAGVDEDTIATLVTTLVTGNTAVTWVELTTDYTTNTTWAKTGLFTGASINRSDVRTAEDSVAATASNAVAQTLFNRVTWLG